MREELQKFYQTCEACTALYTGILGPKRAMRYQWGAYLTISTQINAYRSNLAERASDKYLVMVDVMSGFFQIYKVKNKSAEQAILKVREWSACWGKPFEISADSGPGFRRRQPSWASQSDIAVGITVPVRAQ